MNRTIRAIYENGVFRPLESVDLDNDEEVKVILLDRAEPNRAQRSRDILAEINLRQEPRRIHQYTKSYFSLDVDNVSREI